MIQNSKVLGIVLARSGSKGLERKNILPFMGAPLLSWPVRALLGVPEIDKVLVSTDSKEYQTIAIREGAQAPFIRPDYLASDEASSIDVIEHAIDYLEQNGESFNYVVLLEPTSPFTGSSDVSAALKMLHLNTITADAVVGVGVVEDQHPSFLMEVSDEGLLCPYSGSNRIEPARRQSISKLYYLDGSLYISKIDSLLDLRTFYHSRTLAKKMEKWKNIEIDSIEDFVVAEALGKFFQKSSKTI